MMDQQVKQRWLNALRGGDYKQGRYTLRRPGNTVSEDTYCCLGVLCDVVDSSRWISQSWDGEPSPFAYGHSGNSHSLDDEAMTIAGVNDDDVEILMNLNDFQLRSFGEIANYVEANL